MMRRLAVLACMAATCAIGGGTFLPVSWAAAGDATLASAYRQEAMQPVRYAVVAPEPTDGGATVAASPSDTPAPLGGEVSGSSAATESASPAPPSPDAGASATSRSIYRPSLTTSQPAPAPQPFKLFNGPGLKAAGINVGGWVQQGLTFNFQDPQNRFNGPVATNDRDGEYQLNQFWLYADRPTNTGGYGIDLGGRIDMTYGTDFRFGVNRGLEDRINSLDQYYGLVIPQAYAELAINRLTLKMGHFAGILSYEAVPAVANFFYSHSYAMGYAEPLLVTGMLGTYKLTDQLALSAAFHRGWMMFEDNNDELDFMGGIAWTSLSKKTSIGFNVDAGPQDDAGQRERFVYSLVAQQTMSAKLRYVITHNLGFEDNGDPRTGNDAEWYGITQYMYYQLSPKWTSGVRFEWFRDDDGARVAGVGNLAPGHGWPALPGFAGNFYECSLGLNWQPCPNVRMRPEARWDWYEGTRNLAGELPFDDGNLDHQFLLGTDLLVTF